jgi:hypothetical protein
VIVTGVWVALLAAVVVCEVVCRRSGGRWLPLESVVARLWAGRPGRVLLVVAWAFVGWHLFARHGSPA